MGGIAVNIPLILFTVLELIGTVAFALSGTMTGLKYKLDIFGVLLLSITAALGGGVIRDLLIGRIPPMMFQDYKYLMAAVAAGVILFLLAKLAKTFYRANEQRIETWNNVFDALGLGAFTVTGVQAGMQAGYGDNGFLLVFLALLTGIGGGVLRDLLVQRMPLIFHKRIYALADILGACLYLFLYRRGVDVVITSAVTIAAVFAIRMLATRYHWNLPKAD